MILRLGITSLLGTVDKILWFISRHPLNPGALNGGLLKGDRVTDGAADLLFSGI